MCEHAGNENLSPLKTWEMRLNEAAEGKLSQTESFAAASVSKTQL